jgi:hypothetical protein
VTPPQTAQPTRCSPTTATCLIRVQQSLASPQTAQSASTPACDKAAVAKVDASAATPPLSGAVPGARDVRSVETSAADVAHAVRTA